MNKALASHIYLLGYVILLFSDICKYVNIDVTITNNVFRMGLIMFFVINALVFVLYNHYVNFYFITLIILLVIFFFSIILKFKLIPIELIELFVLLANVNLLNLKEFLKLDLVTKILIIILILLLNLVNISPDVYNKGMSLGFTNSNAAGYIGLSVPFSVLLLIYNKHLVNIHKYYFVSTVISIALLFIIYSLTQCRAVILAGVVILIFLSLIKFKNLYQCIFKFCIALSMIIPIFAIYITFKFNPYNSTWHHINKLLSNRLIMQHIITQNYPLDLLGRHIPQFIVNQGSWPSLNYNLSSGVTIDNFYLSTSYYEGIIGLMIIMFVIINVLNIARKYSEYIPYALLFSSVICSCITSGMLESFNFSIILYIVAFHSKIKYNMG